MSKRDDEIKKEFLTRYKNQWDRNQYFRDDYDENLKSYVGHRNPSDYPLAFNENFNRILPIIETLLSRFMDQIYQTSNIVSVKPRHSRDVERAKAVEGVLNFQMSNLNNIDTQGGSYLTLMKWFKNTLMFGKGITKAYWRKEERISPKRMALQEPEFDRLGNFQGMKTIDHVSQEWQTVYDGPYVETIHPKLFVPHVEYKDIQKMPAVFLVYSRSLDYVKRQSDKGIYKNLKDLSVEPQAGAGNEPTDSREAVIRSLEMESAALTEDEITNRKTKEIDILECYGKCILEDSSYTVGSGYKIKGREEEVIAHIGNYSALLSLQKNTYGMRPLFDMGAYLHPELYWDIGLIKLTRGIQEQVNNLGNLRMANAFMMINPMIKVDMNSDIDPEALKWKPFGIVPVESMDDVEPLIVPDTNSNLFMEQENFYKSTIQDLMGMYDYGMGQTPQRQERVGVVYGIQAMGEARAKLLLMSMDYLGLRPLLKYLMILNTFHLPSGFEYRIGASDGPQQFGNIFGEDIHSDFDFAARYTSMEPALGKQARSQQLVQMAGMWAENPWINQYQYTKLMMELMDIREAEYLLKNPQQFAQEQAEAQKAAMMAEQQTAQFETQGKIAKSQVDSQGRLTQGQQDNQGKLQIQGMKSITDLAIAGIEAETAKGIAREKPAKAAN